MTIWDKKICLTFKQLVNICKLSIEFPKEPIENFVKSDMWWREEDIINLPIGNIFLELALTHYGLECEIICSIEECSEFIQTATKQLRKKESNIQEEIADAIIMLCQMRRIFGTAEIDAIIITKQKRLKQIMGA